MANDFTGRPSAASGATSFARRLALAWPLILSNLTMALIQATDVVLMGWLGAAAAGRLGAGAQPDLRLQFCSASAWSPPPRR